MFFAKQSDEKSHIPLLFIETYILNVLHHPSVSQ